MAFDSQIVASEKKAFSYSYYFGMTLIELYLSASVKNMLWETYFENEKNSFLLMSLMGMVVKNSILSLVLMGMISQLKALMEMVEKNSILSLALMEMVEKKEEVF